MEMKLNDLPASWVDLLLIISSTSKQVSILARFSRGYYGLRGSKWKVGIVCKVWFLIEVYVHKCWLTGAATDSLITTMYIYLYICIEQLLSQAKQWTFGPFKVVVCPLKCSGWRSGRLCFGHKLGVAHVYPLVNQQDYGKSPLMGKLIRNCRFP